MKKTQEGKGKMAKQNKVKYRRASRIRFCVGCILVAISVVGLLVVGGHMIEDRIVNENLNNPEQMQNQSKPTIPSSSITSEPPTPKPIIKTGTATIGATGDVLLHNKVIQSGYDAVADQYDYQSIFSVFSSFVSKVDYAVANLEVTLCGDDNGYAYSGYPCFNAPDAIVDALKSAGFDMLLTANNHSFDTGSKGFFRTQEVLNNRGLEYIGTRPGQEDKNYIIKDVNGIKIGMINYTYNTGVNEDGSVSLNFIPVTTEASGLINTFNYQHLDDFYAKIGRELEEMKAQGAEAIMLYIHWGDEYSIKENATQREMAQALCDLGIDVIVGNHAHVPQPVELLTNTQDANKKTLCLYSTGNSLSNIRRGPNYPAETEDGMLFQVTFAKYSDGTVVLERAQVLPTWVNRYVQNGKSRFQILTMDGDNPADWQEKMDLTEELINLCQESFDRTMAIVGDGLKEANEYYGQHQKDVENSIGVSK